MKRTRRISLVRPLSVFLGACIVALYCGASFAQPPGPGGPPPSPEQQAKVWEAQAKAVAQDLGLSAELTGKLVDAYKAARKSHFEAMRAKMTPGERPDFAAMMEVAKAERAKLETALKGILPADKAAAALAPLGAFPRRWDSMVAALEDMKLDGKVKDAAMKLVTAHVVESAKLMEAAGGDREKMRGQMKPLRDKLDADLAKILSADQMAKWKETTAMRGGRGDRGPDRPAPAPAKPAAK